MSECTTASEEENADASNPTKSHHQIHMSSKRDPSHINHDCLQSNFQKERQNRVISELTCAFQTVSKISSVLDEILDLADDEPCPSSANTSRNSCDNSLARKQKRLIEELENWNNIAAVLPRSKD